MARVRRPQRRAPALPSRACWRRLATAVLGLGVFAALLVLAFLGAVYFLPGPLLVVPAAAATVAVGYVTVRSRGSGAGAVPRRDAPRPAPAPRAAPRPRPAPAWPTGRRRRSRAAAWGGYRAGTPTTC